MVAKPGDTSGADRHQVGLRASHKQKKEGRAQHHGKTHGKSNAAQLHGKTKKRAKGKPQGQPETHSQAAATAVRHPPVKPASGSENGDAQRKPPVHPAQQQTVTALPKKGNFIGSNWQALKQAVSSADAARKQQQQQQPASKKNNWKRHKGRTTGEVDTPPHSMGSSYALTPVVALDCEMVGVGPQGRESVLGRVCVVNFEGNVLLDTFVKPNAFVTDFRTRFSGVRPRDMRNATPHAEAVAKVKELVEGRILVGHALHNDFRVLGFTHPPHLTRDTAKYQPLMAMAETGRTMAVSLKALSKEHLGLTIQSGEHSPVDDARASLYLYRKFRDVWERSLKSEQGKKHKPSAGQKGAADGEAGSGAKRKHDAREQGGRGPKRRRGQDGAANLDVSNDPMADL